MTEEQREALFDIALRMAQDLREYADAAEEAGEHIQATDVLLEEFDAVVKQMDQDAHEDAHDKPLPDWVLKYAAAESDALGDGAEETRP